MTREEQVSVSHKQFSEIVEEARGDGKEDRTAYRFSNGRRFDEGRGPYDQSGT